MDPADPKACLDASLRLLARRDHSCHELTLKLVRRRFSQAAVDHAVAECRRLGYLDDGRFTFSQIRHLRDKGYGVHRIRQVLIQKGVSTQIIDTAVLEKCSESDQIEDCRRALNKKRLRSADGLPSAGDNHRLYRFLSQRGYSSAVVRQVLDEWRDVSG